MQGLSLLCLLVVAFAATAEASHTHFTSPKTTNHSCTLCLSAHHTPMVRGAVQPEVVVVRTILFVPRAALPRVFLLDDAHSIRPPPAI